MRNINYCTEQIGGRCPPAIYKYFKITFIKRNPYIYSLVKAQRAHRPIFSELEGLEPWLVSHVDVLMVATD